MIFNGRSEDLLNGYLNISTNFSLSGKTKISFILVCCIIPMGNVTIFHLFIP